MNNKKVSIIIPAYNEEKYLPACLESLLNLNYPKEYIEIILVDNGSTDKTREVAESYGAKVLQNDLMNVSGLRNFGTTESTGEIIAFLDADTIVSKEWLDKASVYFDDTSIAAWGGPPVPPEKSTWVQKTWFLVRRQEDTVQDVDWLGTMNFFVRKEQFEAIRGFNDSLVTCEDVDFSYRIHKYGRIVSDSRIEVTHLGEAATVREFMRKEIWRGSSNLKGIKSHGLLLKELPSLIIPLYFGILLPISFLGFITSLNPKWFITCILFYLFPTLAVLFKIRRKIRAIDLFRLLVLLQIYFLSRTIAVLKRA